MLSGQSLQSLLAEAMKNNPQLQQYQTQYEIASERVSEANTLPNTEVGMGYFVSEPETRTGPQRFKISLKQMMPWFGTISARENYQKALAEAQYEDYLLIQRKLILSVSQSYYKLYALQSKQRMLSQNIRLLDTYETMALTSVEIGKASAVDVLRLQMRQNELEQTLAVMEQDFLSEQTNFNSLLNRPSDSVLELPDSMDLPESMDEVYSDKLTVHPELLKLEKLYASVEQAEELNQKEQGPMIGFGLDYINVSERPNMDFADNGKDVLMPMVTVSIPIFNKKYASVSRQNELRQRELTFLKQDRYNILLSKLDEAIKGRNSARIRFNTQMKNLQQAQDVEQLVIRSYESGTVKFNDLLDVQELQLKLQLNQVDAIKDYFIQSLQIAYLTN